MTKKEILWREILHQAIENKKIEFTQKELAQEFGISTSTVFNALKIPRQLGAVKVTGRNFKVVDAEKFLYLWATQRNIDKEVIYQTNAIGGVREIEGFLPAGIIFAGYSAYVKRYNEASADYDKVYVYADADSLRAIKKRFPKKKGYVNLIVLKADFFMKDFGEIAPNVQIFADLWNFKDWYAKEFLNSLKQKMFA